MNRKALDAFTRAYLTAALFTSDPDPRSGEFCEHDDWTIANIDPACIRKAIADCERFQRENAADLALLCDEHGATDEQNGHDFFLTRCHHGAGFWDRGYGDVGDRLTDAAQRFGEVYVYGPETCDNGASTEEQIDAWDKVIYIE